MIGRKLWYVITLLACALLPLAGCSGGSSVKATEQGTQITVGGEVDAGRAAAKAAFLSATSAEATAGNGTVFVYNAQDGAQLASVPLQADGSFSNLTFTLPATKTVLVFKAVLTRGVFRTIVPIDLSNPPTAGITGSNPISIRIDQNSTNIAVIVSNLLGLTGVLGDPNQTLNSVNKSFTDAAQAVINNGGQQLAFSSAGLTLTGRFSSASLLPAQDANVLGSEDLNNSTLDGQITSVAIPGNRPIVSFQVTNAATGKGIRGLRNFNLVIAQLKPGANGSPDEWLSYMVTATSRPTTDQAPNPAANPPVQGYTVIDNGDGSYTVLFAKDIKNTTGPTVSYNAALTHRVMVGVRSTPAQALLNDGSILSNFWNEKYFVKDFIPATPDLPPALTRDMLTTEACNECHGKIGVTTPHGGRGDVRYCMMCHTSQRGIGAVNVASVNGAFSGTQNIADGEVLGDFVILIHKIHMGSRLTKAGYNYRGRDSVRFNEIHLPKDVRNCRQCHHADTPQELARTPQGNNWKTEATRKSCGACHDHVNFVTGEGHLGGPQPDDSACTGCHPDASELHLTNNATPNNPNTPAGLVNFYYEVASADVDPASNDLSIRFRIQQNTGSLSAAKSNVVFNDAAATGLLTGFSSGPSFLLAYFQATPNQPALGNSADYNNFGQKAAQPLTVSIDSLRTGANGTLGAPDADGFYTAVVNSAAAFPAGATLRAVGLQGTFTQQAGTGGIAANTSRPALSAVKEVTGDEVRREVIDSEKCGKCHEWFFGHGGSRVAGLGTVGQSICTLCHVPNLTSSGRGIQQSLMLFIINNPVGTSLSAVTNFLTGNAFSGTVSASAKAANTALVAALGDDPTTYPESSNNLKDMIHGVHAGSNSLVVGIPLQFVRDRGASGEFDFNFQEVTFPGVLKDCRACHKDSFTAAGAVDASRATYTSIAANVQASTQVTTTGVPLTLQTAVNVGNNVTQVDADRRSLPNAQDLVRTPFVATCRACHSRPNALAHFSHMGGQLLVPRSQANPAGEACVTCHGTTGPNALWNVHRFSVVGDD